MNNQNNYIIKTNHHGTDLSNVYFKIFQQLVNWKERKFKKTASIDKSKRAFWNYGKIRWNNTQKGSLALTPHSKYILGLKIIYLLSVILSIGDV